MVTYLRPELKVSQQFETNEIKAVLNDDDDKEFNVTITYDYHLYYSPYENETVVTGYDWDMEGTPNIRIGDLMEWVEEQIKQAEPRTVTFNI